MEKSEENNIEGKNPQPNGLWNATLKTNNHRIINDKNFNRRMLHLHDSVVSPVLFGLNCRFDLQMPVPVALLFHSIQSTKSQWTSRFTFFFFSAFSWAVVWISHYSKWKCFLWLATIDLSAVFPHYHTHTGLFIKCFFDRKIN